MLRRDKSQPQIIFAAINKIEQEAQKREKLALGDIDKEDEANALFIQSIKAKLAFLQFLNWI